MRGARCSVTLLLVVGVGVRGGLAGAGCLPVAAVPGITAGHSSHPTLPPFQDASDRAIISGNMNLIWAWAATVPTMPSGGNGWLPMHDNRGSMTLNLLGGAEVWHLLQGGACSRCLPCQVSKGGWTEWGGGAAPKARCDAKHAFVSPFGYLLCPISASKYAQGRSSQCQGMQRWHW